MNRAAETRNGRGLGRVRAILNESRAPGSVTSSARGARGPLSTVVRGPRRPRRDDRWMCLPMLDRTSAVKETVLLLEAETSELERAAVLGDGAHDVVGGAVGDLGADL